MHSCNHIFQTTISYIVCFLLFQLLKQISQHQLCNSGSIVSRLLPPHTSYSPLPMTFTLSSNRSGAWQWIVLIDLSKLEISDYSNNVGVRFEALEELWNVITIQRTSLFLAKKRIDHAKHCSEHLLEESQTQRPSVVAKFKRVLASKFITNEAKTIIYK